MLKVYTDGGSRGNPGPSAIGVYITDETGKKIDGFGKRIGTATNNVAEYKAVIKALDWLIVHQALVVKHREIAFFLDSQLIYSQITGLFKVKHENMRPLVFTVHEKMRQVPAVIRFVHVRRSENTKADTYVNMAFDAR